MISWVSSGSDEGSRSVIAIPAALSKAIERVAPGWRIREASDFAWGETRLPGLPGVTHRAVVADLDGDGRLEAVLLGVRGRPRGDTVNVVVLGVSQSGGGFGVRVLSEEDATPNDMVNGEVTGKTRTVLTLESVAGGAGPASKRRTTWVRYQDGECQGKGTDWTYEKGQWRRRRSPCAWG